MNSRDQMTLQNFWKCAVEAKTVPGEALLVSGMNLVWENLRKGSYWIGNVDQVGLGKKLI